MHSPPPLSEYWSSRSTVLALKAPRSALVMAIKRLELAPTQATLFTEFVPATGPIAPSVTKGIEP